MSYLSPLLGQDPRSPRSPLTPRTLQSRFAIWLAVSSVLLSCFVLINSQFSLSNAATQPRRSSYRVVLRSFMLNRDGNVLTKPLLIAEEELTDEQLGLLQEEQTNRETIVLEGLSKRAHEGQQAVQQLVQLTKGGDNHLTEEIVKRIQREFADFSITEEDEVSMTQSNEASTHLKAFAAEDAWVAQQLKEIQLKLEELRDTDYDDDHSFGQQQEKSNYPDEIESNIVIRDEEWFSDSASDHDQEQEDFLLVQPDSYISTSMDNAVEGVVISGDGNDNDAQATENNNNNNDSMKSSTSDSSLPDKNGRVKFSYLEILSACLTLDCLKKAHKVKKDKAVFNFPHALIMGWQDSAIGRLADHLGQHPQSIKTEEKFSDFFTDKCHDSPSTACSPQDQAHYILHTLQRREVTAAGGNVMAFESSTDYASAGDLLAEQVVATLPWLKVVSILREPISRALSVLVHSLVSHNKGCLTEVGVDLYGCLTQELVRSSEGGSYTEAMSHWLKAFPQDQIQIVQYESLFNSDRGGLRHVKQFLGLDDSLPLEPLPEDALASAAQEWSVIRRDQYLDLVATVRIEAERLATLLQQKLGVNAAEWMNGWQRVWDSTLQSCDARDMCRIGLL